MREDISLHPQLFELHAYRNGNGTVYVSSEEKHILEGRGVKIVLSVSRLSMSYVEIWKELHADLEREAQELGITLSTHATDA